jgi:hypothetical protein
VNDEMSKAVIAGLKAAINDHGPITRELITSAAKRIVGHMRNADQPDDAHPLVRRLHEVAAAVAKSNSGQHVSPAVFAEILESVQQADAIIKADQQSDDACQPAAYWEERRKAEVKRLRQKHGITDQQKECRDEQSAGPAGFWVDDDGMIHRKANQQAACSECGHSGGVETDMGYSCPTCSTADQQEVAP